MIKINHLSKKFGEHYVLDDISLTIPQGKVVALIGPSGSGKSTLLRCINLLERPTMGEIAVDGEIITHPKCNLTQVRQKIGFVFQHFHLFPHMTVLENLTYAPLKIKRLAEEHLEAKARQLLLRVGLGDKGDAYPARLSGGQKQRAAIARTLMMEPEIILFDEPTSALDPEMVSEVLDVIKGLAHTGITMLIATHEMSFAREVADRILFLAEGKMLDDAPPREFFKNPQTSRAKEFLEKVLRG
jgi:polar amino acid transport system ATP-binding protein